MADDNQAGNPPDFFWFRLDGAVRVQNGYQGLA